MTSFDFTPTTRTVSGRNSIARLGTLAKELGATSALIVSDPGIVATGHVSAGVDSLTGAGVSATIFHEVAENPTTEHVETGVAFARQQGDIDLIVGLGGGSSMDCAKGINFLLSNGGKMSDYWGVGKATKSMLPSIGIPTTAGTGSEAQSFALIADATTHQKMACGDIKARFRTVILDPTLLVSVPREVAGVTGVDAIAHAVESLVSTRSNTLSRMFSKEAWRLLIANLATVLREPDNIEAWSKMQLGANFAGWAIENSMLGAAHACANPMTARFGVTHGVAVGVMLPHVVRFNSSVVNGAYSELAEIADVDSLPDILTRTQTAAGLPDQIRELGIDADALPELAREAAKQWTATFNPRSLDHKELLKLYEEAY